MGKWDSLVKRLVAIKPQHFVQWLLKGAVFVRTLDIELKSDHLFADALLEVQFEGQPGLLHLEFQTYGDEQMGERLMEYNVRAFRQYHLPVFSSVIYLVKKGDVIHSPLERTFFSLRKVHDFYFDVIQLWEMSSKTLFEMDYVGLLPFATLTRDGKRPEVIDKMIEKLVASGEIDLLKMAEIAGGLVFKKGPELEAFRRRFSMYKDILSESPVYQEIGEEFFQKGVEEGIKKGIEEGRETLMGIVQKKFPELVALAKQQTDGVKDAKVLQAITLELAVIQSTEEARQVLLEANKQ